MEGGFERQTDWRALRDRSFVIVMVHWSPENHNEAVLSNGPEIPRLFVLGPDGAMPLRKTPAKTAKGVSRSLLFS